MKAVNTYYRKHKTLDGCPELTAEQIAELKADKKRFPHLEGKPYPTWALSNNNAEIRRVKERIEELSKRQESGFVGWEFNGGEVRANIADNRAHIARINRTHIIDQPLIKWTPKSRYTQSAQPSLPTVPENPKVKDRGTAKKVVKLSKLNSTH